MTEESGTTELKLGYYGQIMDMLDKSLLEHNLMSEDNIKKMKIEREKNKNNPIDNSIEVTFMKRKK